MHGFYYLLPLMHVLLAKYQVNQLNILGLERTIVQSSRFEVRFYKSLGFVLIFAQFKVFFGGGSFQLYQKIDLTK